MPQSRGMEADDAALRAYYERGMERERLSDGRGDLEFTRTTEIVLRRLPAAPAIVADIGGGPGRYALWLASLWYQVEHRDLVPLHVEQLTADAAEVPGIHTAVGDAQDLDLPTLRSTPSCCSGRSTISPTGPNGCERCGSARGSSGRAGRCSLPRSRDGRPG